MAHPLERRIARLEKIALRRAPRYVGKTYSPEQWAEFSALFTELVKNYEAERLGLDFS